MIGARNLDAAVLVLILLLVPLEAQSSAVLIHPGESIQDAIDKARPGDVLTVDEGTYIGTVNITKPLSLRGKNSPSLDALGYEVGLCLSADGIEVSGLVLRNASKAGIYAASKGNSITDNVVTGCGEGISLKGSGNVVSSNLLSRNSEGIVLRSSSDNELRKNEVRDNQPGDRGDCGIVLRHSENNTIANNLIVSNGPCAITLYTSSNNTIVRNNASGSRWYGIYLADLSNGNVISDNDAVENGRGGICLEDSRDNAISGNRAKKNGRGVYLACDSYRNVVEGNVLEENGKGVHLAFHSNENVITENLILYSGFGIYLSFSAARNLITRNYLVGNGYNAYDEGAGNRWDDGLAGNFYDDLGLVYNIPGGESLDRHPLRNITLEQASLGALKNGGLEAKSIERW